jgi:hypothetical protein
MDKVKIHIKILGGLKHKLDINKIKKWRTSFFEISQIDVLNALPNTITSENDWCYSDKQIRNIIGDTSDSQIVVAIINHPLERNFYVRKITDNCCVFSLYETADIVLQNDLKIEHFIIQNLYFIAAVYYKYKKILPTDYFAITHHDIRGCLFDFNAHKEDLVYSLGKVSICDDCKASFDNSIVPKDFVKNIKTELKGIKKSRYYILRDFIKRKPIFSIFIGVVVTLTLNILGSFLFSKMTSTKNNASITDTTNVKNKIPEDTSHLHITGHTGK